METIIIKYSTLFFVLVKIKDLFYDFLTDGVLTGAVSVGAGVYDVAASGVSWNATDRSFCSLWKDDDAGPAIWVFGFGSVCSVLSFFTEFYRVLPGFNVGCWTDQVGEILLRPIGHAHIYGGSCLLKNRTNEEKNGSERFPKVRRRFCCSRFDSKGKKRQRSSSHSSVLFQRFPTIPKTLSITTMRVNSLLRRREIEFSPFVLCVSISMGDPIFSMRSECQGFASMASTTSQVHRTRATYLRFSSVCFCFEIEIEKLTRARHLFVVGCGLK